MANQKKNDKSNVTANDRLLAGRKKLRLFPLVSLVIAGVLLLLLLPAWTSIFNSSDASTEIEVSGYQYVSAGLSGNYTSIDNNTYGGIAHFNAWVPDMVRSLAGVTIAVMFVVIGHLLVQVFATITNKQGFFNILCIVFAAAETALFIACFAIARSMEKPMIAGYCSGNPACSLHSQAILPALFAILSLASPILALVLDAKNKKAVRAEEEAAALRAAQKGKRLQKKR